MEPNNISEWYRRTRWRPGDAVEFEKRLARARRANRAQYLRIQAITLEEQGLLEPALELARRACQEYPDDFDVAAAHASYADILVRVGEESTALYEYRKAMVAQRRLPQFRTWAHLGFAYLVARTRRTELYDEALGVLEEFGLNEVFPLGAFKRDAARALILADRGQREEARAYARSALAAARQSHSGFRRHAAVGLVNVEKSAGTIAVLEELLRQT